ncbi:glucose 1-dehydrogenase [Paenibacillus sediminis]|uniref:NAD(P)-dependent dehydrogenase (Short-subunit alcohol dehydrogenase family) n=1 Tax=Paenibacillus sediminis TaxID=664909 RepID=A0ABS4H0D4_9BACL|nr:glucose 1-dehydrogenase [Paenibacillus sediminis]MBP1935984.1 NAD(P)-dependent dehydrogenase (short-subunit alcohol dehydrogenase family) [Paenibacillus sediminis]
MAFESKVVIVTGAAQGIGQGVAKAYASKGANVILADIQEEMAQSVVKQITSEGGQAMFIPCDVRSEEQIQRLMNRTVEQFGTIDILINNAGISPFKSLFDLKLEEWDHVLNTNVRSTFLCTREAALHMRSNKNGGSVVNMSSTRALMSEPNAEAYAASKGAIVALTHAMAISLGEYGIRVNCISPGWIETGDYGALREEDHKQHPAGRVGEPMDVARACLYLTDPSNTFVTGINLVVDGGMTRKMIYEE